MAAGFAQRHSEVPATRSRPVSRALDFVEIGHTPLPRLPRRDIRCSGYFLLGPPLIRQPTPPWSLRLPSAAEAGVKSTSATTPSSVTRSFLKSFWASSVAPLVR